jgi:nucleoside-diphosphate-sugar epimerase
MRVLVMGGTRFIGAAAVRHLSAMGCEVAVFHRGESEGNLPPGVQHIRNPSVSLINRSGLAASHGTFARFAPDVVLDMLLMLERDAQMTVDTLRGIAGRIVVISSGDVYRAYGRLIGTEPGEPVPTPLAEGSPLRARHYPYRREPPGGEWTDHYDKILVEQLILGEPALPGTVLRLPMVYGPNDRQHRLFEYVKRMDDGRPVILLDELTARWKTARGYVEDIGHAIALAVTQERAAGRVYNVAEQTAFTEMEWGQRIGEVAGWQGKIVLAPVDKLPARMRPQADLRQHLTLDSSRSRPELGYAEQTPAHVALELTIDWERANPPASIDPAQFDYAAEDAVLAALSSLGSVGGRESD